MESKYGGTAGIAVAGQDKIYSAGISEPRAAWSTSKVPVAIAAERAGSADPSMISQAITYSDNAAAENLWQSLGGGQSAASAASAVLAETGLDVQVQPTITRPGFSAFGRPNGQLLIKRALWGSWVVSHRAAGCSLLWLPLILPKAMA